MADNQYVKSLDMFGDRVYSRKRCRAEEKITVDNKEEKKSKFLTEEMLARDDGLGKSVVEGDEMAMGSGGTTEVLDRDGREDGEDDEDFDDVAVSCDALFPGSDNIRLGNEDNNYVAGLNRRREAKDDHEAFTDRVDEEEIPCNCLGTDVSASGSWMREMKARAMVVKFLLQVLAGSGI